MRQGIARRSSGIFVGQTRIDDHRQFGNTTSNAAAKTIIDTDVGRQASGQSAPISRIINAANARLKAHLDRG